VVGGKESVGSPPERKELSRKTRETRLLQGLTRNLRLDINWKSKGWGVVRPLIIDVGIEVGYQLPDIRERQEKGIITKRAVTTSEEEKSEGENRVWKGGKRRGGKGNRLDKESNGDGGGGIRREEKGVT